MTVPTREKEKLFLVIASDVKIDAAQRIEQSRLRRDSQTGTDSESGQTATQSVTKTEQRRATATTQ